MHVRSLISLLNRARASLRCHPAVWGASLSCLLAACQPESTPKPSPPAPSTNAPLHHPTPAAVPHPGTVVEEAKKPEASAVNPQPPEELPANATTEQLHQAATAYLNQRNFPKAAEIYLRILQLRPEDEESHFNAAYCFGKMQQTDKAIHHYEECIKLVPEYAEAHNNLGNLLVTRKQYDEALNHFRTALKSQPESSSANNNVGKVMAIQNRYPEAIAYFREAVRLNDKNLEARYNLAIGLGNAGQIEESEKELRTVLQLQPGMEPARRALESLLARKAGKLRPQ